MTGRIVNEAKADPHNDRACCVVLRAEFARLLDPAQHLSHGSFEISVPPLNRSVATSPHRCRDDQERHAERTL